MPIFDQGYQHWKGRLAGHAWRWLAITRHGVRTQLRSRWLWGLLLMSMVPALLLAGRTRFRPIIMTTMAALFGGLPLALGTGTGSELRRPLGITIVGGLIVSQILTLYTTPVVYLYLDKLQVWFGRVRQLSPRLQTYLTDTPG